MKGGGRGKEEKEVMKEGGSVDLWKREDQMLKIGEFIPAEKHGLQSFALIIAVFKSAIAPVEHISCNLDYFLEFTIFWRISSVLV